MVHKACRYRGCRIFTTWGWLMESFNHSTAVLPDCLCRPPRFYKIRRVGYEAISRYRVTHSGGPNFAYDLCVRRIDESQRASLDLSTWSVAYNGAEPVRHETLERFAAAFAPCGFRPAFYPAYGLAEATLKVTGGRKRVGPVYCAHGIALEQHRIVSAEIGASDSRTLVGCGRAALGTEVVIVNPETLMPCASDEVGEIWVCGPRGRGLLESSGRDGERFRSRTAGNSCAR